MTAEPRARRDAAGELRMNRDRGEPSPSGRDARVIGKLDAAGARSEGGVRVAKTLTSPPLAARGDRHGNLGLLLGTGSGDAGRTRRWIGTIRVDVERVSAVTAYAARGR